MEIPYSLTGKKLLAKVLKTLHKNGCGAYGACETETKLYALDFFSPIDFWRPCPMIDPPQYIGLSIEQIETVLGFGGKALFCYRKKFINEKLQKKELLPNER